MKGAGVLLLLLFITALPVLLAFWWFRRRKIPLSPCWFLLALAGGMLSVFAAGLLQAGMAAFKGPAPEGNPLGIIMFGVFFRVAFTEELSRLVILVPLFMLRLRLSPREDIPEEERGREDMLFSIASGITAGLGFALVESASYGASNLNIALLRAVTAAPLHGACGGRTGYAAAAFRIRRGQAVFRFFSAVMIHGMYNLILINPVIPSWASILLAFAALTASVQELKRASQRDET